ncbi:polyribonucleotide nucleotidyltransferase [Patescibacteria group bacterium]|nr:polyribonucleotide nucleotidyltransferase [Patescibacteria group bacterium]
MKFNLKLDGKDIEIETNSLAEQANGSALVRCGDTMVLATAVMDKQDREDRGFFPLTVEYQERYYAAGKIGGGRFMKREARPSDEATLNARIIDRSIRPRFPKELTKEVQIITTVLSWDGENDPDVLSLIATSTALSVSNIPWNGPLGAIRVCRRDNQFILNPNYEERKENDMDIMFVGLYEKKEFVINMIEGGCKEVDEKSIMDAYDFGEKYIKKLLDFQKEIQDKIGEEKYVLEPAKKDIELEKEINDFLGDKYEKAFFQKDKAKKSKDIENLTKELGFFLDEKYPEDDKKKYAFSFLDKEGDRLVHEGVLKENKRVDGRKLDEVRRIIADVSVLPRTHGTGLFSRGLTKSLSILTLGSPGDQQLIDGMEVNEDKRFMHHYNFPPYSVGETGFMRGPGRREIGHGLLAEKALTPLIPSSEEYPYTIRIVSEILSSNGSSSMASTSSSALALMDAGVPIKRLVTGVAMGLIKDDKEYKILADIQGPEDHHGDMDFKVAGTREGITAIQMDVKIEGITRAIMEETLKMAKKARYSILDVMEKTISKPAEPSKYAPRIITITINPSKIGEIIGPGGKVINKIIDETGAQIDIEDSGQVFVTSDNSESAEKAVNWIKGIVEEAEIGKIYEGEVKKIMEFGAFVEVLPGKDGLIHISKLSDKRVEKVGDIVKEGEIVSVKVLSIDAQGKISLQLIKK